MNNVQTMTRRKFVSLFAAIAVAFSMMGIAPSAAFATATAITPTDNAASVTTSGTINMSYEFVATGIDESAQHIDYKVTATADGGAATINKHSGILTPSAAGSVTVTAYLVDAAKPTGVSSNPCYPDSVLATATKTVAITESSAYGYQGNNLQIRMTSFSPAAVSHTSAGYQNTLSNVTATDGVISFNYTQNYGIGKNTFSQYQTLNAGKIVLQDEDGIQLKVLGDTGLTLAQQGSSKTNLTVNLSTSGLVSGDVYKLVFLDAYVGGNGQLLGTPVTFEFSF